jgi:phospholipid N-methyltransferase
MNAPFKFSDSIKLIRNIKTTGTVAPSSQVLIKRLLAPIDFGSARCVVELGPGNGCVTRALLSRMHADAILVCVEVNSEFATHLRTLNDPRLHVYNVCASSIGDVMAELNVEDLDHVVSSLPLALIDDDVVERILANVGSALREGGRFLQYQYSLNNYSELKPRFKDVKLRFTLRNMPPAFVYECTK